MSDPASYQFSSLVSEWFATRFSHASPIQTAAWPAIQRGEHVLITAPTGSGKTLTAFLSAIDSLVSGRWETGATRVLYVSPLKALNSDIARNLEEPLQGVRSLAEKKGVRIPTIRTAVRSGDTPSDERARMVSRPPEILITTPESLNLILSSPRARRILTTVRALILDEVHAVIDSKRGTHLLTAIERVVLLSGEFQRIALSATVRPVDEVASFVGGRRPLGPLGPQTTYEARSVTPVQVTDAKRLEILLHFPDTRESETQAGFWPHLRRELRRVVDANRSTLIFVNSRRHAEKIALLLNEGEEEPLAYSHHGSLSRELRHYVESSLKEGRLRAIVATSSLELGIDIGTLERVVLVGTPVEVRSGLQRAGRSGHQLGAVSRAELFPLYGRDLIDAAVMSELMQSREIEETRPVRGALDVLAQVIIAMTVVETWQLDALYAAVRMGESYAELPRSSFDLVVEMLCGRYAEVSIRELSARVVVDRVHGTITAAPSARLLLYSSGGTIPDRGYYGLRTADGARIGELDEEFVWERRVGESFALGSQIWTIQQITSRDVVVLPAAPGAQVLPFWRGLLRGRDPFFAERVLQWLEKYERNKTVEIPLSHTGSTKASEQFMAALRSVLEHQRQATGVPLPHRHHLVVEHFPTAGAASPSRTSGGSGAAAVTVVIHTLWGARVNTPLAIALGALMERSGCLLTLFPTDDSIVFMTDDPMLAGGVLTPEVCGKLCERGVLESLLRERLESSNLFGALFRENAGRALLLPKKGFGTRTPLWLTRMKSRKIVDSVRRHADFPIMLETWRSCLQDVFALDVLRGYLEEVVSRESAISICSTGGPSPFAQEVVWQHTNLAMYADDSRPQAGSSMVDDAAVHDLLHDPALRPRFERSLTESIEQRLQRLAPGYAPCTASEIAAWLEERLVIYPASLLKLKEAVVRDAGEQAWDLSEHTHRFFWICSAGTVVLAAAGRIALVAALYPQARRLPLEDTSDWDRAPDPQAFLPGARVEDTNGTDPPGASDALLEIMQFYGPKPAAFYAHSLGIPKETLARALMELLDTRQIVEGVLTNGSVVTEVCDAEVVEYLLRARRRANRFTMQPQEAVTAIPFWARRTGIAPVSADGADEFPPEGSDRLVDVIEVLFGYPAPAAAWENELLPVRVPGYHPLWLDGLLAESPLHWTGMESRRVYFLLAEDAELLSAPARSPAARQLVSAGPLSLGEYAQRSAVSTEQATKELWQAVWRSEISNTGFQALRTGIHSQFRAETPQRSTTRVSRRKIARGAWAASRPTSGRWQVLRRPEEESPQPDPITSLEQAKDMVRLLLTRYGVLYRSLLSRELSVYSWPQLFKAMRIMELSGEIQSGVFLRDLPTPQFAFGPVAAELAEAARSHLIYWMNATDPASPCGVIPAPEGREFPVRVPGNHLVFRGPEFVMASRRQGRDLTFYAPPTDDELALFLAPLRHLISRRVDPLPRVSIEQVNGVPVRESEYAETLLQAGFRNEFKSFVLSASYR